MIPGRFLYRLAGTLCSPAMRQRVIEPQLADLQHEWADNRLRVDGRAFLLARGYLSFWLSLCGCLVRDAGHHPADFARRVGPPAMRVVGAILLTIVGFGWLSWVETGAINWAEAGRRYLGAMVSGLPFIVVLSYRNRYAQERAWLLFVLCAGVAFGGGLLSARLFGNSDHELFPKILMTGFAFLFKRGDLPSRRPT